MTTAHDSPDSAELAPPQDDLATRKNLGPYELKKKLGQGGMGAVYLAVDTGLRRQVALKILPREKASNPQLVKRFKAEAQNASQLTHDNIVAVYGAGEADGYLYIALEFVDGIDVHDLVQRRGVLPVKRSIDIIKQVARALQHALDQGIVHRDIKPANLLIRRDGMVKLADMGLARAVDETMETGITRAGTTVGTVDYMSPEQARNSKAADVRSDIYSLGCTWYHMLTGSPPYAEGSLVNKLNAHAKQPPPDPRDKNQAVPEGVVAVMQRMLAKTPDDRYQTPAELIKDLEGALVNRDAVSQRILEAIDDDSVHGDEYSDEEVAATTEQSDSYPVEMPWTDSVEDVQSSSSPSDTEYPTAERHAKSNREAPRKESPARAFRDPLSDDEQVVDEPEDEHVDTRHTPRKSKPGAPPPSTPPRGNPSTSHARHQPAPEPPPATTSSSRSSTSKPAAAPAHRSSHTSSSSKAAAPGRARSLPPPKRKSDTDPKDPADAGKSNPLKLVLTALAIVAGIGILVFLANLAQHAGEVAAPMVVGPEGAQPGAPVAPAPPQAANQAAAGTEQSPDQTVKDTLIEIKDQMDGNTPVGQGNKGAAGTQNIAAVTDGGPKNVPAWVDVGFNTNQIPMFSVRRGPTVETERRYATLQEAFKRAGTAGARIVLFHDGPFELTPSDINSALLVIEAAEGVQPRIKLVADGEHRKLPWFNVLNGTLLLDGITILGDEGAVPLADPWSWIRVTNGHLYIRRSSFTLNGKRAAPTTVLKLSGIVTDPMTKEVSAPRLLLDQSAIRGEALRCVQLESAGFEAVIRHSLLVAGDAPAITISGKDKPIPGANRFLKFVNATVSSREQALLLSSQGINNPVDTEVNLYESLFAAPTSSAHPTLLSLEEWPAARPRAADAPPYKNLRWKAAGSAILGFQPLLKASNDDAATITDGPAWRKLFREEPNTTFSTLNWPTEAPANAATAPLKTWSLKSLESLALTFPDSSVMPGCPVSNLRVTEYIDALKSGPAQPQRPRVPAAFAAKTPQQVDLNKTDLGKFIASKEWEDGTVFVASGSGQKYSSPISVGRHKWRIQFRQTDGPTLQVAPRSTGRSGGENAAFISIAGGQLDIEHGSFNFDPKDAAALTPWFLYAEGGGFHLVNCRIQMPAAGSRSRGVIRWEESPTPEQPPPDMEFANYAQITDSLIVGSGTLFSGDLAQRAILLNNTALVSRQHLFELNVGLNDGKFPAAFDAQNCTFIAGGTHWSIKSAAAAGSSPLPSRFFLSHNVFTALPPDSNSKAAPLLMNYAGAIPATTQLLWFEESCGYAPSLKTYFASEAALPVAPLGNQTFETEWVKRWGAERIQRPLLGADGVLFEKNLPPSFTQFKSELLNLHKTAKARNWSESGGSLGVRVAALDPPPAPPKAPAATKKPAKAQPKAVF